MQQQVTARFITNNQQTDCTEASFVFSAELLYFYLYLTILL